MTQCKKKLLSEFKHSHELAQPRVRGYERKSPEEKVVPSWVIRNVSSAPTFQKEKV